MLVAFLILPYGCERDEEIDISTKAKFNAPSITQAKQHVEQHTTLNLKDPNNFLQSRDLEGSLTVDWELSGIKEYKDEPEQQVDILYTPIYINNDADAKMFVGSVEYNGEIKSNIFCLIYTDLENTTTFSGYILRFDLNGALLEARKYQNGSIVNPQDNTSEGMSRTNCDNETIFDMLIMLLDGGGSLSNWHGCLDTVVVYGSNTSIDAGDSTGGGSPLDSAIVTSINIPALETNSNNPAGLSVPYWYTQSVTANGFNISLWLEIHPLTPIAQWLMTEATIDQLQQLANFLNAHKFKIRDEYPLLNVDGSDGFEPADSPTASTGYAIDETAKGITLDILEFLTNNLDASFHLNSESIIGGINIDNSNDLSDLLNALSSMTVSTTSSSQESLTSSIRLDTHTINIAPANGIFSSLSADLVVLVKLEVPDDNNQHECLQVISVNSMISGNTINFSWNQILNPDPIDPNGVIVNINEANDEIKITITGELGYGINFPGYGSLGNTKLGTIVLRYRYSTSEIFQTWFYTE